MQVCGITNSLFSGVCADVLHFGDREGMTRLWTVVKLLYGPMIVSFVEPTCSFYSFILACALFELLANILSSLLLFRHCFDGCASPKSLSYAGAVRLSPVFQPISGFCPVRYSACARHHLLVFCSTHILWFDPSSVTFVPTDCITVCYLVGGHLSDWTSY